MLGLNYGPLASDVEGFARPVSQWVKRVTRTETLGPDKYKGRAAIKIGPVNLYFAGEAEIVARDEAARKAGVFQPFRARELAQKARALRPREVERWPIAW